MELVSVVDLVEEGQGSFFGTRYPILRLTFSDTQRHGTTMVLWTPPHTLDGGPVSGLSATPVCLSIPSNAGVL